MLDERQKRTLLTIARESIEAVFAGGRLHVDPSQFDEVLRRPAGAFVTLNKLGELRGCIGSIEPAAELVVAVSRSAVNAAFRDPRFHPVTAEEMSEIDLEVSVMGPVEPVRDIAAIVPGRDGLIVSRGRNAGLLLPQVASEYGWDRETFLDQTCRKAGLAPGTWRGGDLRIEKFSAEVFGEKDFSGEGGLVRQ